MRSTALIFASLVACGGGHVPTLRASQPTTAKSYVVWPVNGGTVTAYRFDGAVRGAAVGSAKTDSEGSFQLQLNSTSTSQVLLAVSSGSYTEPATGTPIDLAGYELTAVLPSAMRLPGDGVAGVLVSPVSHLVAQLSAYFVAQGTPPDAALSRANTLLNAHFGGIDWRTLNTPPDMSDPSSGSIVQLNDSATAALILAGLSMESKNLAQAKNLTPGGPLNSLALLTAVAADIAADHYFDGQGSSALRLTVPSSAQNAYPLDGQTVRATLAQGISNFLSSSRNASHIAQTDAQSLMTAIATDNNPQLFRDPGGSVDITPPTVAFVQPAANSSVHGQVTLEATATDDTAMGTFAFSGPAGLTATPATSENAGRTMRLKTILDVSAFPDGPLTISVAASDAASNTATQNLTIRVANHGPIISVSSPSAGQAVKGSVTISAIASGQNGATVTGLSLLNPPTGAGADTLPAADSLAVHWDTTQTMEGPLSLHLQATDSFGGVTDLFVPVSVDNVPFGVVTAHVSAGAPIAGATVTVFAVDDATGQPISSVGTNGQLGQCNFTDATGTLACTLNAENYQGPIQVTASGVGLSYIDPTDSVTVISIPQTFQFSSFIGNYKTGNAISVPLSLWTTLDDVVVLAYLGGADRAASAPHSLTDSLAAIDPLFERHLTSTPWDVRGTVPVSLTSTAQSLRDVVYAAMPDVALNQIARDKSALANVTPGGVITAISLVQLFERDAVADGQFDGLSGATQLKTSGNPQQPLDASWLRYAMAQALDEWFKGSTNKTSLASSDLQNAGVFDTVASDTSILFPSSAIPPPYDNTPPTVNVIPTFTNNGSTSSPVTFAAQQLVAGSLHLTVTASDGSGVQATAVQYRGTGATSWSQMPPSGGSSPTSLSGTIDTTALSDGLLTVAVLSTDKVGNAGTTIVQYVVDNTAPTIGLLQPLPPAGYPSATPSYSSAVPASITVSDNQSVASIAETSFGVPLSNASTGGWVGSWSIPSSQADGSLSFIYKACDVVFNCRTVNAPFAVDRTPPTVSITKAPARYSRASVASISATAADATGSGVAAVFAQDLSTNAGPVLGVYDSASGTWTMSGIALKSDSDNTIIVYAKDNALDSSSTSNGANSGFGRNPPYQATALSMTDTTPPLIGASASQPPSYYDERGMHLRQFGGQPANLTSSWYFDPSPSSNSSSSPLLGVDISGVVAVHKTLQRIAMGTTTPSLSDLFGTRGSSTNTPYISLTVPYTAGSEAPITGASYSAAVSCAGCPAFGAATGALIPDTINASNGTRYVLPLSSDFIPALGQIASQATVIISASASDAAGNTHALQQVATVQFALDAPPIVAMVQNTNYLASGDPWALSACKIADGTYSNCFAAATPSTPAEGNRLVEYVVYNLGASYGLSFQLSADPADSTHSSPIVEGWEGWDDEPLTPAYPAGVEWCTSCGGAGCRAPPYSQLYYHFWWLTSGSMGCPYNTIINNPSMTYAPAKQTSAPLAVHVYRANNDGATIAADALVASNNSYVIPASSGGYMGMALLFVGRTSSSVTRFNLDAAPGPAALNWNASIGKYESPFVSVPQPPSYSDRIDCNAGSARTCLNDRADWTKQLDFAQSNVYGALTNVVANGYASGTTTPLGSSTAPTTVTLTTNIAQ